MQCSNCGKAIPDDANLCPYCGNKISGKMEESTATVYCVSSKSRILAAALCILGLLGPAGLHRMYVGKWKTGILYMLTFGVFLLGTLYDLYQLCTESFKDTDGFPLYASNSIKSNYRIRDPHGSANRITKILALLATILTVGSFTYILLVPQSIRIQQQSTNEDNTNNISQTDQKSPKDAELELVEKVKTKYQSGDFMAAGAAFKNLEAEYPDSQYIEALKKDYPDLQAKSAAAKQKRKAEKEKAADAFNNEMTSGPGSALYEGCGTDQDGARFCVYVNSAWHALSEGEKTAFTELAYTTYQKYGLNHPMFYVVNINTHANMAHYSNIFGVSIDK